MLNLFLNLKTNEDCVTFTEVLSSEGQIRTQFKNQRGVYLWTHVPSSRQYIGSSLDLSTRLGDYFKISYLTHQSSRGSYISAVIIKYGLDSFHLSVLPIEESKDHVALEQHLLNNYQLELNLNRNASGKRKLSLSLPPLLSDTDDHSTKVGPLNPQFGKTGITSLAARAPCFFFKRKNWAGMGSQTFRGTTCTLVKNAKYNYLYI